MRMGRFAGVGGNPEDAEPLSLGELLLVDLAAADDPTDERIATERVRSLTHSALFLLISHLVCGATILLSLLEADAASRSAAVGVPLTLILLLDGIFWFATRRERTRALRPHLVVRFSAVYVVASGILWSMVANATHAAIGEASLYATELAIAVGFVLAVPAFFSIPAIIATNALLAVTAAALFRGDALLVGSVAAATAGLSWFSLVSARDSILSSNRRMATEWQAEKARRFVADFEQSGRGWFWETSADGALCYVSEQLAKDFEVPAHSLVGRKFADLLLVEEQQSAEALEKSLSFHLAARFPFAEVTVRPKTEKDIWWSLSGTPNFDDYGRFLGFRGIGADLSEQRRSEAEISRLARFDSLTGLPNRVEMRRMLDEAVRNAAARKRGCSLFLIDLDRFKNVNDTLGHPAGDELLRQVSQRLTSVIGDHGQIGRLGGDEFKAVLPGLDDEGRLASLAQLLIQKVSMPYVIDGHNVTIGASAGIAISSPERSCADALIRDADLALYVAKGAGRGRHCFFAPVMHSEAKDRQILENDLRNAITREELHLLYQPLVNAVTEEVVGFEALLRWEHPKRGRIMPLDFVPLAEECGLIGGIGAWVLRTACAEAAKWPEHLSIAVNLSPVQFANAGLPKVVMNAIASVQIDPARVELEITESVLLADSPSSEEMFRQLKGLGVRLVLDDFGTGYSSLAYLQKAPFDKIKIDQTFVRGASEDGSRDAAIVKAIVAMAESLGMETTAEGAETAEELQLIRALGCSQVQGYVFGRPMEAQRALELAAASKPKSAALPSRQPRQGLLRLATLKWDDLDIPVRLRNISVGGALLESSRGLAPGARVELDLPPCGRFAAEVRWSQEGRLGIRFEEAFDLSKLAALKQKGGRPNVQTLVPDYLDEEELRKIGADKRIPKPKDLRRF